MFNMLPAIDTHLHVWDLQANAYAWLDQASALLQRSFLLPEIAPQLAGAGVQKVILVQAANHLGDTDYMLAQAARTPWVGGVVGWLPLLEPGLAQAELDRYGRNAHFKGVRHLIHDEVNPRWLLQPPVLESLHLLAQTGLHYEVVGTPVHLRCALAVAEQIPQLPLVLDHLCTPRLGESWDEWRDLLAALARHPQVYIKISGLGTVLNKGALWGATDVEEMVGYALAQFGPARAMAGGDWPVALLAGEYGAAWANYRQALATLLPPTEQAQVLWQTAAGFYRLAGG
ncbi:MAG: amidohydrolase family protein [Bernardetiaceae bacterium]|jgi:L-fuconolactonase|nr:amidohydrolase family protein [Bernardetiaceae bacterium]